MLDGYIYDHEIGILDAGLSYAETGPIEMGSGDNLSVVTSIIPDTINNGDVTASFYDAPVSSVSGDSSWAIYYDKPNLCALYGSSDQDEDHRRQYRLARGRYAR
jgi:hypothetical protein